MPLLQPNTEDFLAILRSERRDLLDRLRKTQFSMLKEGYSQTQIIPYSSYSPWLDDRTFVELFDRVKERTMVDIYRCYELYTLARQMSFLSGDFVEVGVWRGGTAALIAGAAPQKAMHLFDTFRGVTKAHKAFDTLYSGGEHADADGASVERWLNELGLRCSIRTGTFPDETSRFLPVEVCFAHIDVDTYASARESFFALWPLVQPKGIVVFDDYGFFGCEGVAQAVNEITSGTEDALFVHNLNGHALLIKMTS